MSAGLGRQADALEATIPVPNHEFPQVILPFLKRLASVALEAHSECDGVHRPVQLQLMGKLSPSEDDHPKAQRAQNGHTLRVRRTALFIEMVRAVVFNPRTARRCIYIDDIISDDPATYVTQITVPVTPSK